MFVDQSSSDNVNSITHQLCGALSNKSCRLHQHSSFCSCGLNASMFQRSVKKSGSRLTRHASVALLWTGLLPTLHCAISRLALSWSGCAPSLAALLFPTAPPLTVSSWTATPFKVCGDVVTANSSISAYSTHNSVFAYNSQTGVPLHNA